MEAILDCKASLAFGGTTSFLQENSAAITIIANNFFICFVYLKLPRKFVFEMVDGLFQRKDYGSQGKEEKKVTGWIVKVRIFPMNPNLLL